MPPVVIANPILDSPFREPARHFRFDEDGIRSEIAEGRSAGRAVRFGKLTVLTARMNPDLAMAEELLKKTRTGNLFTVFGQPGIDIRPAAGAAGELEVEIHGLDVYDPTTGVVRSDSTDDIACWSSGRSGRQHEPAPA